MGRCRLWGPLYKITKVKILRIIYNSQYAMQWYDGIISRLIQQLSLTLLFNETWFSEHFPSNLVVFNSGVLYII